MQMNNDFKPAASFEHCTFGQDSLLHHLTAILPLYVRYYTIIRSCVLLVANEQWRIPLC